MPFEHQTFTIFPQTFQSYYFMKNQCFFSLKVLLALLIIFSQCTTKKSNIKQEVWGNTHDKEVYLYTLKNSNGMVLKITNYGGIITSIMVPDKNGVLADVVLGFDNLQQYLEPNPCFGATIGRFANRIRDAKFEIDGTTFQLTKNAGGHCIHGANEFDRIVWDSEVLEAENAVKLYYLSKNGTNGFPGNLEVYVTYKLTENNAIEVKFEATTDKATHVNLTQHSYFNLNGGKELIYNHQIKINADNYTAIDEHIIPTGEMFTVIGTDWDLTEMTRIGDNIHKLDHNGYHYCYAFNNYNSELQKVIEVVDPESGRTMDVITTQPGVQFYSGNSISDELIGKGGKRYGPHTAFCLETQHFPDTPNHSNFPSTLLLPGEKYEEVVIYDFGIVNN